MIRCEVRVVAPGVDKRATVEAGTAVSDILDALMGDGWREYTIRLDGALVTDPSESRVTSDALLYLLQPVKGA